VEVDLGLAFSAYLEYSCREILGNWGAITKVLRVALAVECTVVLIAPLEPPSDDFKVCLRISIWECPKANLDVLINPRA